VSDTNEVVDLEKVDFKELATLANEPILKFFSFAHLPSPGREMSQHFAAVAYAVYRDAPRSAERAAGLRKLLEAKDCCVRSVLP